MAIKQFNQTTSFAINEETDAEYSCTFKDAAVGAPTIESTSILTLLATLSDVDSGEILGGRELQNVNGVNGGSFTSNVFTLRLTGNVDNIIWTSTDAPVKPRKIGDPQRHRLQLDVTYSRGSGLIGYLHHEVWFDVINLKLNE